MMLLNSLGLARKMTSTITVVCLFQLAATNFAIGCDECKTCETCDGEYGTSIRFAESPAEAAKQALKDEKLVFVLHVSGNFETPEYT